jgi:hypothetical protein
VIGNTWFHDHPAPKVSSLVPTSWLPLAAPILLLLACHPSEGTHGSGAGLPYPPGDPGLPAGSAGVYDESRVVDINLTFPAGAWDTLLTSRLEASQRWVPCAVSFAGQDIASAACRRKGNMFDWDKVKKPQMVVRFNMADPSGRMRGLRRLNFEYFEGLDAPIRDRLAMWLMRQGGVDAPRANHVRVFKDGVLLGLYINIEVIDKEFLEDHFGPDDEEGNLWEGGEELETNEEVKDDTRVRALARLVRDEPDDGDHAAFFQTLPTMIDVRQFLRVMAAETVLLANDNFSNGGRNFYYYEHPKRGIMLLPWDMDAIFSGDPTDSDPFAYFASHSANRLRVLMNLNPEWRTQFVDDLVDLRDNVLSRLPAQVDLVCDQIREFVRQDPNRPTTVSAADSDCNTVKNRIGLRAAALTRLLGR